MFFFLCLIDILHVFMAIYKYVHRVYFRGEGPGGGGITKNIGQPGLEIIKKSWRAAGGGGDGEESRKFNLIAFKCTSSPNMGRWTKRGEKTLFAHLCSHFTTAVISNLLLEHTLITV
jgi:hypothetical protein